MPQFHGHLAEEEVDVLTDLESVVLDGAYRSVLKRMGAESHYSNFSPPAFYLIMTVSAFWNSVLVPSTEQAIHLENILMSF